MCFETIIYLTIYRCKFLNKQANIKQVLQRRNISKQQHKLPTITTTGLSILKTLAQAKNKHAVLLLETHLFVVKHNTNTRLQLLIAVCKNITCKPYMRLSLLTTHDNRGIQILMKLVKLPNHFYKLKYSREVFKSVTPTATILIKRRIFGTCNKENQNRIH